MDTIRIIIFTLLLLLPTTSGALSGNPAALGETFDKARNDYIGKLLRNQLPSIHFSGKKFDEKLVQNAFQLYLKQLDFQKRFLLQSDVATLRSYVPRIPEDIDRGTLTLPSIAADMLQERIGQAEKMVSAILAQPISRTDPEQLETDPEKLAYVNDIDELRDRWRRIVRAQVIGRFLDLEEDQKKEKTKKDEQALWREAVEKVAKQNKNFFHRLAQDTLQDQYDRFYNALARAFDPHTNYITAAGKEQFDISMSGSLEGIGAVLSEEDGFIKVKQIMPGSASARQGRLQAGDTILQVAQGSEEPVDVTDMRLNDVVRLVRGPKGSEVRLTVKKSDGAKEMIPIIRDVVQIEETFVKSMVLNTPSGQKIGYILIPSFYHDFEREKAGRNSAQDTRRELEKLKAERVDGIILDLRNNGGGALTDAVAIVGLFIDKGPVVQVKNARGNERVLSDDEEGEIYAGPLLVMVNKFSASASEIVAAALQDYGRAVIVGDEHTHGKGTVQTVVNLDEERLFYQPRFDHLGALKVTVQKFYRINGNSTQFKGVEPDILLPSMVGYVKSGEKYLDFSLPWDTISPVGHDSWQAPPPLEQLRQRSEKRVERDKAFIAIREEAKSAEKRSGETLITLTASDMRAQKELANQSKKKMSEYFRRLRADDNEDEPPPEENRDEWMKNVREEPYVREAERILLDMLTPIGDKKATSLEKRRSVPTR
ncbi:MAG: carboxy terminal-processing peptidase [Desulfobulbaceae bacterium]|jgi:carboxyl-terminal processing protease|nr:carboxy terminal-processing peptidase [Desulfobulbaceae bacterium]